MASVATTGHSRPASPGVSGGGNPIAWTPGHELDTHEWAVAGRRIGAVGRCIQWLLGDWITYGHSRFGERYARAARITGYDAQTLMNMVYVASRFQISRRREELSWSHHETLAALEREEQDQWLDRAVAHRWSVADLRMMVRASRNEISKAVHSDRESTHAAKADPRAEGESAATGTVSCPRCGETVSLEELGLDRKG